MRLGIGLGLSAGFGGSGAIWTPAARGALLRGWYKGDVGVVTGASGSWADQSGIGNSLTANVTGISAGTSLNGRTTASFPAGAFATKNAFSKGSAGAFSAFMVVHVDTGQVAVEVVDYGDGGFDVTGVGYDGTSPIHGMLHNFGANADGTSDISGAWHVIGITSTTGGSQTLYVDNVAEATQSASASIADALNLAVGGSRAGVGAASLAELIIYSDVPSSGDRASTFNYLKAAWALP